MNTEIKPINGADLIVKHLLVNEIDKVYCVPGESYLPVLESLFHSKDDIQLITCRHEAGAANMAEAYGKLTQKPGVCFVTRGPGATHASIGVHTAFQDSSPMVLFIGQVSTDVKDREGFQEIDFTKMFEPIAKKAIEIQSVDKINELVHHAFQVAVSDRPGPVVISLPENILKQRTVYQKVSRIHQLVTKTPQENFSHIFEMLEKSNKPIIILGGRTWDVKGIKAIQGFAEKLNIPVATAFRFQDRFNNLHPLYAGDVGIGINPDLAKRIKESDLLISIGPRLGEMTTSGYSLIKSPHPEQALIHVHSSANELGRVYQADLAIQASLSPFCEDLFEALKGHDINKNWKDWAGKLNANYIEFTKRNLGLEDLNDNGEMAKIVRFLSDELPSDSIWANGAGNYTAWVHRFHAYEELFTQLAPTSGAMGYGVPAAIAAKSIHPEKKVIAFAGDGCFMMSAQELATAIQYNLNVMIIVVNNSMYGTIRMHQEKTYPANIIGTDLVNPNFAEFAKSFGFEACQVKSFESFKQEFDKLKNSEKPVLIEILTEKEQISPTAKLSPEGGLSYK